MSIVNIIRMDRDKMQESLNKFNNIDLNIVNIILSLPRLMSEIDIMKNCKSIRSNLRKLRIETSRTSKMIHYVIIFERNCNHQVINMFHDFELLKQYTKTNDLNDLVMGQLQQALLETKPPSENFE